MSMCVPLARGVLGAPVHTLSRSACQGTACWQLGPSQWELSSPRLPQLSGSCRRGPEPVLAAQPGQGRRGMGAREGPGRSEKGGGMGLAGALGNEGAGNSFPQVLKEGPGCPGA